jgi:signal transduction histidine kinase
MPRLELPKRTASLQVDYTATSLAMPERVRFRYRLDGVDDAWVDAGTRRQAFYTNPAPGDYTFRVIAANHDGIWNKQGAAIRISVPPMFYQTRWFTALCIIAAGGIMWVIYMLRLKELGLHIRSRLHERHLERERIARELHDTLLQSIQGLILRFQAVAEGLPSGAASRDEMERVLDRADAALAEGRNRVLDLRSSSTDGDDLSEAFTKVAADLAIDHPAAFRVITEGTMQPLDPIVRDELFRIGREALVNAYRHADAEAIDVEIVHARDELRLRFMDNGRGIDTTVLDGGRPGHWGLSGMRERAERIGATLRVRSRQGSGTEVEVRMPAGSAYRPCLKKSRWTLVRRLFQEEVSR